MRSICLTASLLLALVISPAVAEWRSSPGDAAAHRHFSGDRITAETVGDLAPLWRFDSGQKRDFDTVQSTPVFTGSAVVTVTIAGDVVALDPALAYLLYFRILQLAGSSNLMLVTIIVPVFAVALDAAILGQFVTGRNLLGFAVVAFGLLVLDGRLAERLKKVASE